MAIGIQDTERPGYLLGLCGCRGAGGGISTQVWSAHRCIRGIHLSYGQSVCFEPRQRGGGSAAGREQLLPDWIPRQWRYRGEDLRERLASRGRGAILAESTDAVGHLARTATCRGGTTCEASGLRPRW